MRSSWSRALVSLVIGLQGVLALIVAGCGGLLALPRLWSRDQDSGEFADLGYGLGLMALVGGLFVATVLLGALVAYRRGSPSGRVLLFVVQILFLFAAVSAGRSSGDLQGGIVAVGTFAVPTMLLAWETVSERRQRE